MKTKLFFLAILLGLFFACSKDEPTSIKEPVKQQKPIPETVKSSEKQITDFRFTGIDNNGVKVDIPGEIDEQAKAIATKMPSGTEITALEPVLEIPDAAVYEPLGPQDFSTPINYTVTAEDGTSRTYLTTVEVALSQKEILLRITAANPNSTLDWKEIDDLNDWEEVTLDENGLIVEINLFKKNIAIVPPEIGQLSYLGTLLLNHNDLHSLPPEIGQLSNLQFLDLNLNELSSLPKEIGHLSSLETLTFSSNSLNSLPPEFGQLSSLRFLNLTNNKLDNLPPEIGQLSSLEILGLQDNYLSSLPPEIGQLSNLEGLFLDFNDLSSLPSEIGQLSSLRTLSLTKNNISSLPSEMRQLVNLKELYLNDNNLSQFNHVPYIASGDNTPSVGCSTEATNLEHLGLLGNPALEALKQCICDLDTDMGGTVDIDVVPNLVRCEGDVVSGK
ncbi:leucine-rich repeat domain-containing protein [Arenibacter sp. F20364]|uniref:leucine-rich repeat domain-containing protein n=1 Tax=Arenibacter sp. F20364 TaxID=2926415 RepID=UPI001FF67153|nr:leucine-rich repeat domain-containing protein [Arenibacter sp. F20364]MCK0189465.1 hypothetical protein [Arenibacter sp. F20364]